MCSPCVDFGSGGEAQEPVQADSATSSFLASLRAAGIVVPQGVVIGDRVDRAPPATVHGAPAVAAQHEQRREPLGGGRITLAVSAHPAPVVQCGQAQSFLHSDRASSSQAGLAGLSLGISPHEVAFREVTFAESEREFAEEDATSSSSERAAVSEGHRNILSLLYQLCPGAAPKSPPAQCRVCDFEGLFASVVPTLALEGAPTLFHHVAELCEEHQTRFRAASEAGKAVTSALLSRRRDRGCCSDPSVASSAPMNPAILRLFGALSNRRSLSFSLEEAARVESLCNGLLAAQSSFFFFFFFSAFLHWLNELVFEALYPSLVLYDSDFVPDVAFLCSFLHVAGFSGSHPKRMPAVLVLCFGMSFVPIVTSMWYLLCGFLPPARSSITLVFGFLRLGELLSGAENRAHLRGCVFPL